MFLFFVFVFEIIRRTFSDARRICPRPTQINDREYPFIELLRTRDIAAAAVVGYLNCSCAQRKSKRLRSNRSLVSRVTRTAAAIDYCYNSHYVIRLECHAEIIAHSPHPISPECINKILKQILFFFSYYTRG